MMCMLPQVRTEDGEAFSGSTPTAPFAKWALALGAARVVGGMEAFGFLAPPVQALLRSAAAAAGGPGQLDAPVAPAAGGPGDGLVRLADVGGGAPLALAPAPAPAAVVAVPGALEAAAAAAGLQAMPSAAPSLQTWLDLSPGAASAALPGAGLNLQPLSPSGAVEVLVQPMDASAARGLASYG